MAFIGTASEDRFEGKAAWAGEVRKESDLETVQEDGCEGSRVWGSNTLGTKLTGVFSK